jgi:hypothetical protein
MIVQAREGIERGYGRSWNLAAAGAAAILIVIASGLRVDAGMPQQAPATSTTGKFFQCRVTDKDTGKPIAGAKVLVRISVTDPTTHTRNTLAEIRQRTSAEGTYSFHVSRETFAEPSCLLYVEVDHPGYVRGRSSYRNATNSEREKPDRPKLFENIKLERGKAITGRLLTPEGNPAANVKINAYTTHRPPSAKYREIGSFTSTSTDADGCFRLNLLPSGPAVFWILPTDYALSTHVLKNDKRGDLGTITLEMGNVIQGTVLNIQGKAVAGVYVQADGEWPNGFRDAGLIGIGDSITRSVVTDRDGTFTIRHLPACDYRVTVVEEGRDPATRNDLLVRRPLPGVFAHSKLTVNDGVPPEPLVIREIPHVVIEARNYDSKGKPCNGNEWHLNGWLEGNLWSTQGRPDASGRFVIEAPLGLEMTRLGGMASSHRALRHRLTTDAPLESGNDVDLGTLDHDIKGLEIIHYEAAIVTVTVVSEDGQKPKHAQVSAEYFTANAKPRGTFIHEDGARSDVAFEEQNDGRFRSSMLFPDERFKLTVTAPGYEPRSEILSLAEGITKDLTFTLKAKKAELKTEQPY